MTELNILLDKVKRLYDGTDELLGFVSEFDSEGNEEKEEHLQQAEDELETIKAALDSVDLELRNLQTVK